MPNPLRVRNARGELIVPTEVSASDAKNGFGRILERVAARRRPSRSPGGTSPFAVVIPVETYTPAGRRPRPAALDTLSADFDALLARMQAPGVGARRCSGRSRWRRRNWAAPRCGRRQLPLADAPGRRPRSPAPGLRPASRFVPGAARTARRGARRRSWCSPAATGRARAASAVRRCARPAPTITTRTRRPEGSRRPTGSRSPPVAQDEANAAARNEGRRLLARGHRREARLRLRDDARRPHDRRTAGTRRRGRHRRQASGSSASRPSTCISIGCAGASPRAGTTSRKPGCASASGADAKT